MDLFTPSFIHIWGVFSVTAATRVSRYFSAQGWHQFSISSPEMMTVDGDFLFPELGKSNDNI